MTTVPILWIPMDCDHDPYPHHCLLKWTLNDFNMFGGAWNQSPEPGIGDTDEPATDVARSKQLQAEQPAGANRM
jgi:hypothetical protein